MFNVVELQISTEGIGQWTVVGGQWLVVSGWWSLLKTPYALETVSKQ